MKYQKLILLFVLLLSPALGFSLADSTGLKIFSNNKVFISHKVDKGQSLYSIAKRYKVSIEDIYAFNPELKTNGLKADAYIFIPTSLTPEQANWLMKKAKMEQEQKAQAQAQEDAGLAPPTSDDDNVVYYKAKLGETLFSISRLPQCQFSVEEIKKWNNLKSNEISEGQKLIIGWRKDIPKDDSPSPDEVISMVEGDTNKTQKSPDVADGTTPDSSQQQEQVTWEEISDQGIATWMPDDEPDARKSYALYNGVKEGTVMCVESEGTGERTYVRVIGPLPDRLPRQDVTIILTEAAVKRLNTQDKFFRVKVVYATENL